MKSGKSLFSKDRAKAKMPQNSGNVTMAAILMAIAGTQLFDSEPVARLFGFGGFAFAIGLIVNFYWKEVNALYEQKDRPRKKIISVLSALTALLFAPLMVALMSWQFYSLYKRRKQHVETITDKTYQADQNEITPFYAVSVAILVLGTCLLIYSNFKA